MSRRKRRNTDATPEAAADATGSPQTEQSPGGATWTLVISILVGLVTALVFWPTVGHQFLAIDDDKAVYKNPHIGDAGYFWLHPYFRLYTPVTDTIYAFLASAFRLPHAVHTPLGETSFLSPAAFHAANVVVHALNAVLVYLLLRLILPKAPTALREMSAGVGALVFGLHPLQVEPVAWVTGANNLFCGFFALIALIFYVRYAQTASSKGQAERARTLFAVATVSFALALMSKPTAVALPLVAWTIDYWVLRRKPSQSALLLVWVALSLICVVITEQAQPLGEEIPKTAVWFRPFLAGDALTFYLKKLILPVSIGIDYGRNPDFVQQHTSWFATWIVPAGLAALLWWRRREWPTLVAAALMLFAWLLPTIGLLPHYFHAVSVVADRYAYLGLAGVSLAFAYALIQAGQAISRNQEGSTSSISLTPALCSVLVLALMASATVRQVGYWRDTGTIVAHSASANPNGWFAQTNLATWLDHQGNPQAALPHARAVIRLHRDDAHGYANLARILDQLGQKQEAIDQLRHAIDLEQPYQAPGAGVMVVAQNYLDDVLVLANLLVASGRQSDATGLLEEGLKNAPGYPTFQQELAVLQNPSASSVPPAADVKADEARQDWTAGKRAEALKLWNEALALDPKSARIHSDLGIALFQSGQSSQAIAHMKAAVSLNPSDATDHKNLGQMLLSQHDRDGAVTEFRAAVAAAPDDADAKALLAKAMKN